MNQKPYAAFGYVLIENTYADGETYTAVIGDDIKCTTFWVQGMFSNKNLSENTELHDFTTGWFLRPSDYVAGTFEHKSIGGSKVFCFDQRLNNNQYVELTPLVLTGGAETILPKDTKLFLCAGQLAVNNINIDKPTQLNISSGNTLVTAVTDCYWLIFE
jgi:hypothetical protein